MVTWKLSSSRCDHLVFLSTEEDQQLGAVAINVTDTEGGGRAHFWEKTIKVHLLITKLLLMQGFRLAWDQYREQADWFLRIDDDAYVILENLR